MKILAVLILISTQLAYGSNFYGTWKVANVKCQSTIAKYIVLPELDCTNAYAIKSLNFYRARVSNGMGIGIKSNPDYMQMSQPLHTGSVAIDKLCLKIRNQSELKTTSSSFVGTIAATSVDCVTGQMAAVSEYELTMRSNHTAVYKHRLNTNLPFYNNMVVAVVVVYELQR